MTRLQAFAGTWLVTQNVRNAAGPDTRFTGRAEFTPEDGALRVEMRGWMAMAGQGARIKARQGYLWRSEGGGIAVCYADGRFFHHIEGGTAPAVEHLCDPDTYRGSYDFAAFPDWRLTWRVIGPRKDYVMRAAYTPVPAGLPWLDELGTDEADALVRGIEPVGTTRWLDELTGGDLRRDPVRG